MKILVTGANGFIGTALVEKLKAAGDQVRGSVRTLANGMPDCFVAVGDVDAKTDWSLALIDIKVVIHLAARAHLIGIQPTSHENAFKETNVDGAVSLARQAIAAGVQRFVFISSIGVNGSFTVNSGFTETSDPAPHAEYAVSKHCAEKELEQLFKGAKTELVIIRPPLVYAANAPGNFRTLLKIVSAGLPLPLMSIRNARTLVSLNNLVDFISLCARHPKAAGELFLIGDSENVSTPEIINYLSQGIGRRARLIPCPPKILAWLLKLSGRASMHTQLCGSLVVNAAKAKKCLDWQPIESTGNALMRAAQEYQQAKTNPNESVVK